MNWRTSLNPWALSLKNAVSTGVSYNTPSRTIANQKAWASAGFRGLGLRRGNMRGYGPTRTFPGAGLDGGVGCGCNGGGNGGGSNLILYVLAGVGLYFLLEPMLREREREYDYGE
jgi:hypothetical protein